MQTLVIGDIHGCYEELQRLLDKAALAEGDAIISAGDLVDRGPETPQVLDFFRQTAGCQAVMGNHERKHVRHARHELRLAISQIISRQQFGPAYPAAVDWMASLPCFIELPQAILAHGYMEPGLAAEQQNQSVLCGTMGGDKILNDKYQQPWYELYDGAKPVIVGHHNYTKSDQPFIYKDKVFGLDTNCVNGKALTGLLLPAFRFVSVPSRGNLWLQVRRTYKPAPAAPPKPTIPWTAQDLAQLDALLDKVQQASQILLAQAQASPGYDELTPRQQARLYASLAGPGAFSNLLQLARLGILQPERARQMLRNPAAARQLLAEKE